MSRTSRALVFLTAVSLPLSIAKADEGMWTFDNPPLKQWKERYNFEPSAGWLETLRLASPKVGTSSPARRDGMLLPKSQAT